MNMNDQAYRQNYTVVVKLEKPVTQKDVTVSRFEMSIQGIDPNGTNQTNQKVYDRVTNDNSVVATSSKGISVTTVNGVKQGVITVNPRHSLSEDSIYNGLYRILTDIETPTTALLSMALWVLIPILAPRMVTSIIVKFCPIWMTLPLTSMVM